MGKNGGVKSCVGLFSRSDQKMGAATLQCQTPGAGPQGAGGRLADALSAGSQQYTTTSFSIAGTDAWGQGFNTKLDIIDRKSGAARFRQYTAMETTLGNITSQKYGNVYAEEYAKQLKESMASSEALGSYLDQVTLTTNYQAETELEKQFHQVARLIKARDLRKAERDLFVVRIGGFDAHSNAAEALQEKFPDSLVEGNEYDAGRGRLIPKYPWESMMVPI